MDDSATPTLSWAYAVAMSTRSYPWSGTLVGLAAAAVVLLVIKGVVMGDTHVPVAIEPDAERASGVEVATFAPG